MNEIFEFLRELSGNNNREWFKDNKERYDVLHRRFVGIVQELIYKIAAFDPEIAGLDAKNCIFRLYRDIRFSPDKTPYKIHFGAYMSGFGGRTSPYGGYYLHLQPEQSFLSGGVWCPSAEMLRRLRKDIYDNIEEFTGILNKKEFKALYGGLEGESLKRMPEGFPKDTPYEEILKHKYFVVSAEKPESFFYNDDWIEKAANDYEELFPFNRFLNYTIGEFLGKV